MGKETDHSVDGDPHPLAIKNSIDGAAEEAQLTAIYIGGPNDGQTEEFVAGRDPEDPPGIVRVVGFEVWPLAQPMRPTGRYEPDTSSGGRSIPFVWQAYTPEEQVRRQQDEERSGMLTQGPTRTRIMNGLSWNAPIASWLRRRGIRRRQRDQAGQNSQLPTTDDMPCGDQE